MPTKSRIPLASTGVSSPPGNRVGSTPTQSRIGLGKLSDSIDREHSRVEPTRTEPTKTEPMRSRIPDIRSKISPTKVIHDVDGSFNGDHSPKPTLSSSRIPVSKLPKSPSRIPTIPSSPSKIPTRISSDSLNTQEIDWEPKDISERLAYDEMSRSFTKDQETKGMICSDTRSSSSSSSSLSPQKRGRDLHVTPKMRRTSPDGESASPSKTRRPSPSKIPIAGNYLKNSSSNEDFSTMKAPLRNHCGDLPSDFDTRESDIVQSELLDSVQMPEFQEETCDLGGGEDLADFDMGDEMSDKENDSRKRLHLDLNSKIPSPKIKIPGSPFSAPVRSIPAPNWSIARDEKIARSSQSVSKLPDPAPEEPYSPISQRSTHSTSRLPFVQRGNSDSSSGEPEEVGRRRKTFEAFVMTGDRMINLAKTPANADFQSRHTRQTVTSSNLTERLNKAMQEEEEEKVDTKTLVKQATTSLPSSPKEQMENSMDQRLPSVDGYLVRNSKSEDQLGYEELSGDGSDDDKLHSSCHTLLASGHTTVTNMKPPFVSSESSSSQSPGASGDQMMIVQAKSVEEPTSPDLSTSSLISCSEHYGESLLEPLSPQSPSSPDTPEWSLIANGESFHKDVPSTRKKSSKKQTGEGGQESLISNKDNRVIISISQSERELSPETSSGTITPDLDEGMIPPSGEHCSSPPHSLSSEEESDMDSLHSFHPPVRVVDMPSANRLAKRLYNLEGFRKSDISRHLSKNNDFSRAVAEEYCKLFSFSTLSLDAALRKFLQQFCLTGETQDRERVLLHFSKRFLDCNPSLRGNTFQSHDSVHTLTCAIMLLNTDLHNETLQQRKMTSDEFVENLTELNDGLNFPEELLRDVYQAIKTEPIEWVQDEGSDIGAESESNRVESPPATSEAQNPPTSGVSFTNQLGGVNPFLSMPDPDTSVEYKRGYVMRKSCFDANRKKTKLGKRSWKMFYLALRDLVLFCLPDEKTAQVAANYERADAALRIHHSLATTAKDYTKKQFVFRLVTCDRAEYLFQTSDQKELETWVETINTVVARHSSPALPAPCSSSSKFQRPLYPSSSSKLSLSEQLASHRTQARQLSQELVELSSNAPQRGAKAAVWSSFREKSEFLEAEVSRYSTYISVLENLVMKHQSNQMTSSPLKLITS